MINCFDKFVNGCAQFNNQYLQETTTIVPNVFDFVDVQRYIHIDFFVHFVHVASDTKIRQCLGKFLLYPKEKYRRRLNSMVIKSISRHSVIFCAA